ncbi:MAG TPA: hypothetical protein VGA78_14555 [Gemmatimonadales bacterium]
MRSRSLSLLLFVATSLAGTPVRAQEQINRVKSAPQDYRDRQIRLEGEVVELRGFSPRSGQGIYRLVDASDRVGVLIRTDQLPSSGGPFKVRARLSPELLSDGVLLLDESDRSAARLPLLPVAGTLGGIGLLVAVVAFAMLLRTRHKERHLRLSPPMWLIPTGGEGHPEAAAGPEVRFNYHLQYIEEERSELFDRKKRTLLGLLAIASGVGVAGTGWFALLSREDAARPSFVLMTPDLEATGSLPREVQSGRDTTVARRPDDTLRLGLEQPPETDPRTPPRPPPGTPRRQVAQEPPPSRVTPTPPRNRPDTTRRVVVAAQPPPPVVRETTRAPAAPPVVLPLPLPPPPPPPAPPPVPVVPPSDTAAVRPATNPETLRTGASVELRAGIDRLVEAIRTRQAGVVERMYVPDQAEGARRKARFVGFLKETWPGASLAGMETVAVTETSGGTSFTLQFRWRGDFGVDRRKAVRFWASARHEGSRWAFSGVRLLENFP